MSRPQSPPIKYYLGDLRELMNGPEATSQFVELAYRLSEVEGNIPKTLKNENLIRHFNIGPKLSEEDIKSTLVPQFRRWISHKALQDLDSYMSLYLDKCIEIIEKIKVFFELDYDAAALKKRIKQDFYSNVQVKHERVLAAIKELDPTLTRDNDFLDKLLKARNAIAHNKGQINEKWARDGVFKLEWPSLTFRVKHKIGTDLSPRTVPDEDLDYFFILVTKNVAEGEYIDLDEREILEIAFFYEVAAEKIFDAIVEYEIKTRFRTATLGD